MLNRGRLSLHELAVAISTAATLAVVASSCGGSASTTGARCVPGASVICGGPGGCTGFQVCKSDGSGFAECDCGSGAAGGDATSGSSGASGVSASGGSGSPSPDASGDANGSPGSNAGGDDGAQGDLCAAPLTIAPGQTIHATTCGGVAGINEPCTGGPVVAIALDAPDGASVEFTVSPGARFLLFPTCQSNGPVECSGVINPTFQSMPGYILAVNRYDTNCGDFTLSASGASDAGEPPDGP
jgi:hypothetical protein